MTLRRMRDDAPPWSFFLPIVLAVALGILLADAVKLALSAVFPRDAAPPVAAVEPAEAAPAEDEESAGDAAGLVEVGEVNAGATLMLPGPVTAVRDGAERACIGGTVALRQPNGWVQGLEDSAPVRCRSSSP